MRKRRIITRSSLNKRHNVILVVRRVLGIISIPAALFFFIQAGVNALSNQIGKFTQDGYPVDDPVILLISIALLLIICGVITYPHGQKPKGIGQNRRKKPATTGSLVVL